MAADGRTAGRRRRRGTLPRAPPQVNQQSLGMIDERLLAVGEASVGARDGNNDEGEVMAINVRCPACQKQLKVQEDLAGKRVKCPACGQLLVVSAARPAPP